MTQRQLSWIDRIVGQMDQALHTVAGPDPSAQRKSPAESKPEADLDPGERSLAGQLMRVDHAGEVSAQALYQGQALTAQLPRVRAAMEQAAREENDHLAWTAERLTELGTHTSYLNPLWYLGSFVIGATAGIAGDKWSLGFIAETEHQVVAHLNDHLSKLPDVDARSRAILEQMRIDEARHATTAIAAGAATLPLPVRLWMRATSKIMTMAARWL